VKSWTLVVVGSFVIALFVSSAALSSRSMSPAFLDGFKTVTQVASTVPANGDVNPYGVAIVKQSTGRLVAADTLVSNFNSKANVQGTGTTIVQVSPSGSTQLFAQISKLPAALTCPGGVGLTTALGILPGGWVVVGSMPTGKAGALPVQSPAGCVIVLNSQGKAVETFSNASISGPWDMALSSTSKTATLFVSNALTGTTKKVGGVPVSGMCTIVRLDLTLHGSAAPVLTSSTVIGKNYPWIANKAALVLSPTGLAVGNNGTLYVADTQTNTVSAIPSALTRTTSTDAKSTILSAHGSLNAPLGMALAPNGDLLVVNGNNGNAVEITPVGKQIATVTLVKNGAGDLFGLAPKPESTGILFVNDGTNALDLYH
jgi:hypothetical protein